VRCLKTGREKRLAKKDKNDQNTEGVNSPPNKGWGKRQQKEESEEARKRTLSSRNFTSVSMSRLKRKGVLKREKKKTDPKKKGVLECSKRWTAYSPEKGAINNGGDLERDVQRKRSDGREREGSQDDKKRWRQWMRATCR